MSSSCRKICIANSKGGVGKTTITLECAAHAGSLGKRVLVVDMDPQCDATHTLLGRQLEDNESNICDLLREKVEIQKVVYQANENWPNTHVIPSDLALTTLPQYLSGILGYEKALDNALGMIDQHYDLILIDTGPQITVLTQLAMRAASHLVIPTDTSLYAERSIEKILGIADQLKEHSKHHIELLAIVNSASFKGAAKVNQLAKNVLDDKYGERFLKDLIPHCIKVQEAQRTLKNGCPVPAMSLINADHPLYNNYRKLTSTFIGESL